MRKLPSQSGQALLLILLSMAVILTVVLSIVARTTTDITITSREEEALRAFSAAEAGIEKALFIGTSLPLTSIGDGDATFKADVTGTGISVSEFSFPTGLVSGDSLVTWFINHDSSNNAACSVQYPCFTGSQFKVCWGSPGTLPGTTTTPAVEVSVFYTTVPADFSTAKIARYTVDPYTQRAQTGVNGAPPNNFAYPSDGTCQIGQDNFAFSKTLNFSTMGIPVSAYGSQNGLQYARIRMLYNTDVEHPVGVSANFAGNSLLPPQGLTIVSTGTAGSSNRKVQVFQGYAEAPSVFDAAVFSPPALTK